MSGLVNSLFCPHCGYENSRTIKFCARCSRPIRSAREFGTQDRNAILAEQGVNGGGVCPGIDLEPAAIGGSSWRATLEQTQAHAGPLRTEHQEDSAAEAIVCHSCGLMISGNLRIEVYSQFILVRVHAEYLDPETSRALTDALDSFGGGRRMIVDLGLVRGAELKRLRALMGRAGRAALRIAGLRPELLRAVCGSAHAHAPGVWQSVNQCLEEWGIPSPVMEKSAP